MAKLLDALNDRVLLADGGIGSRVQQMDLDVARDYSGAENCTEVLNLSRPDIVREIHRSFLEAGADIIQTNTFGGSPITLGEFDSLGERADEINRRAVELAREAIEPFARERDCYVLGSIGPGTKLPTLGHIDYDTLESNARGQFLLGWNPSPGTAFYVGYNDDVNYRGHNPFNGQYEPGFVQNGRTFFIRASYLFRKSFK